MFCQQFSVNTELLCFIGAFTQSLKEYAVLLVLCFCALSGTFSLQHRVFTQE